MTGYSDALAPSVTAPRRILLLGATFATDNRGVAALTTGALTVLRTHYPDAEIDVLDYGRASASWPTEVAGKGFVVSLINLRFSWKVFLPNNVALLLLLAVVLRFSGRRIRERVTRRNRWLQRIAASDLAVAVSGGDSFSDIYGLERFFYVSLPQLLVVALGKPLILLPQTIGPFRRSLPRWVARGIMRRAKLVYARDRDGVGDARNIAGVSERDDRVRFCYDMGFIVEPRRPQRIDLGGFDLDAARQRPLIGFNISGLLLMGGYDGTNSFRLRVDYRQLVDQVIRHAVVDRGADVLLLPHVFGANGESDAVAVDAIHESLKGDYGDRLFAVRGAYDEREIKHIIGLCDFFVGARMHACIAALSQSIPTVAIAYSDKYTGVLESIGAGQLVADPRHLGIDAIIGIVDNAFEHRDAIRAHLRQVMPLVRNEVLRSLDEHRDAVDLGETLHLRLRTDDLAAEWPAGFRSASLAPGRST